MKSSTAVVPVRLTALALAALLAGCTTVGDLFGTKVDYKTGAGKTAALEVPPDLSQLARDSRYQPQGGVVSAAASSQPRAPGAAEAAGTGAAAVAVSSRGDLRIERQGTTRWLVVPQSPEQLWPLLKAFWTQRGFVLEVDDARVGVMETNWSENRARLPDDVVRNTVGRLLGTLFDSGERDKYRTRVERTASGSEVYISHRGVAEVYTNERREGTTWRARPTDPQLEAEFLTRLMVSLGAPEDTARVAVAGTTATEPVARARTLTGRPTAALEVDEPFDRAWRRVGLALDRSGFTVEDRDRAGGLYFVRYIDPNSAGKDEPNWFQRTWSSVFGGDKSASQAAVRYRIAVQGSGEKTTVSVLTSAGAPESSDNGKRIVGLLVNELR